MDNAQPSRTTERLCNRIVKNILAATLISAGTPMLLMGDDVRRTQRRNNNAYCQDNEICWFDWSLLEKHRDIHRFFKILIEIRRRETERTLSNLTLNQLLARSHLECHGVKLHRPDWNNQSQSPAITANHRGSSCGVG
jgi:glycogen operon protein